MEAEDILRQLFPRLWWRVARSEALVRAGTIRLNGPPPDWLLITATSKGGHAHQSVELDLAFFACVSEPTALLAVVGKRLEDEVARQHPSLDRPGVDG